MRGTKPKIMVIFGTRPEVIKLVPVIRELKKRSGFNLCLVATGQHRSLLEQVLDTFGICPHHNLNCMDDQSLASLTARLISRLDPVVGAELPALIVVQGDTTTTFAGAFVGYCHRIPIACIEAGLRTPLRYRPYPEQINRRLVSVMTDMHFAPTEEAMHNLIKENYPDSSIHLVGNTIVDALKGIAEGPRYPEAFHTHLVGKRLLLVTAHRRENHGSGIQNICLALQTIAKYFKDVAIVFSVHPNPHVNLAVKGALDGVDNIYLTTSLNYPEFISLMMQAEIVLTDSGGIQEEALILGKPVLILREETERIEALNSGLGHLVGTDTKKIIVEVSNLLAKPRTSQKESENQTPYGDGQTAKRIVDIIEKRLCEENDWQVEVSE